MEITKYTGSGGAVEIPDEIDGKKVTSVGHSAFSYSELTELKIPSSVTNIDSLALFFVSLEAINVDEGNTHY